MVELKETIERPVSAFTIDVAVNGQLGFLMGLAQPLDTAVKGQPITIVAISGYPSPIPKLNLNLERSLCLRRQLALKETNGYPLGLTY